MPFSISNTPGRLVLKLEGSVTIRHAQALAGELAGGLNGALAVAVDTNGLADVDTCILQLLCSLGKSVPALSFDTPSEAFLAAVDRSGLRRELLGGREGL